MAKRSSNGKLGNGWKVDMSSRGRVSIRLFLVTVVVSVDSLLEEGEGESAPDYQTTISSVQVARSSTVRVNKRRKAI